MRHHLLRHHLPPVILNALLLIGVLFISATPAAAQSSPQYNAMENKWEMGR